MTDTTTQPSRVDPSLPPLDPVASIAEELRLPPAGVRAVVDLLAGGNTVPFIARYRKEATGSLDEVQIRAIEERHAYLCELHDRKKAVLESIFEQGKLTASLKADILACTTKSGVEDLYLPYKPKRRTRATIAREKGLEPLADRILAQPHDGDPMAEAAAFVDADKGVETPEDALAGARDIVAEAVSEHATIRAKVRDAMTTTGLLESSVADRDKDASGKFKDYYEYTEPVAKIPSHRFLAVRRGEREGVLRTRIAMDTEDLVRTALGIMGYDPRSPFAEHLVSAVEDAFTRLLTPSVESDVRIELKMRADREAVDVFAANLKELLLAAPFGSRPVIGVDPGLRTGCKCAAVDANGDFKGTMTFYIVGSEQQQESGRMAFQQFVRTHRPHAIAVGNGTGGRETEKFVRHALKEAGLTDILVVSVSESGASVYSASEIAAQEFPDLDLTIRGAISIARRLQDPLAELVKIDPKSIGVGQYQHDVHQPLLGRKLDEVVESCVNGVGVELNTASAPLLSRVAGIGPRTAGAIVAHRSQRGGFRSRRDLLEVKGIGPKAFEQAAGFLRIRNGAHPLDASAVHPERYALVERMADDLGVPVADLVGNPELAARIDIRRYVDAEVGEPTLRDIVEELKKPGRDPRSEFEAPAFRDDVNTIDDLEVGMVLEGVVTNVTNFGAFVDVGVHRDGLVHVSELSDSFVRDPASVVKVGQKITVRVIEVDKQRERISFSARTESERGARAKRPRGDGGRAGGGRGAKPGKFSYNPFAAAFGKK